MSYIAIAVVLLKVSKFIIAVILTSTIQLMVAATVHTRSSLTATMYIASYRENQCKCITMYNCSSGQMIYISD